MTRAMLVTVLHRLEGTPAATVESPFTDVVPGRWYTDAITWASEKGIVKGYDAETFGPEDLITREQMATILHLVMPRIRAMMSVSAKTPIFFLLKMRSISLNMLSLPSNGLAEQALCKETGKSLILKATPLR